MKTLYLYDKETGAYTETKAISPVFKSLNKLEDRVRTIDVPEIITVKTTIRYLDDNQVYQEKEVDRVKLQYQTEEFKYQEEVFDRYIEVYEYPECYTEVPLPIPNWKPVWDGEKWIETITEEELEEMNKPEPQEPTELEKLQDQVEFLTDQVAELKLS
ncbi:hypothetical protein CN288_20365 [Bacillus sp. AFS023182]|uniref:hypothetical protein n=1 Tax=Bacillus sp. AFS023182 TaxID=2033492 RepID=UPI000BFA252A|nr:hypothetical protein [Bacillus sp. AFS023182]PFD98929.1 hypothetical protein CN288_20365 [Bacillus sp. AFS023182]